MTANELRARLQALARGVLKGRHVYAVPSGASFQPLPGGIATSTIDCRTLLADQDWPHGASERRTEVTRSFARALGEAACTGGPVVLLVEHADPLIGELDTLTPVFDSFLRDDRMVLFRCAHRSLPPALADMPSQLIYRPDAALHRLRDSFGVEIVEAE